MNMGYEELFKRTMLTVSTVFSHLWMGVIALVFINEQHGKLLEMLPFAGGSAILIKFGF